ncbi:hypothetical protein SAMN05421796_108157 [Chryseobacterium piscicola]|uniref:Uncharacterized protein n=1 Tax=Chryseobacterium piscicola TaxID=551459 RepID=A0A1N7NMN3_9FLAO|nr:hypothetical protein SAMN05421796_108157 [Chryseobacterium piscicola]
MHTKVNLNLKKLPHKMKQFVVLMNMFFGVVRTSYEWRTFYVSKA